MPQATLLGYFTPIPPVQPRVQLPAEAQIQASSSLPECVNQDAGRAVGKAKSLKGPSTIVARIQELAETTGFGNNSSDVFVPTGQPRAAIVKVLSTHTARLKTITSTLLPVRYPDKFFNECLEDETVADLSRVLLWDSAPVGWIRCRLEDDDHGHKQIYVQALGILAPYRGLGLATHLIEQVVQPVLVHKYNPNNIYCHVWESNNDALEWYEKRGFRRVILIEHYYRRLKPAGAWIMRKELS